jgi:putative acetyltransferase
MSQLSVRRVRVEDAAAITLAVADPEVFGGLLQMPYPSEAMWRQRIEAGLKPDAPDLHLVAERDGQVVGMAGLHPAGSHPRRAHVRSLGLWVHPGHQAQGVGTALMQALLDYADNWLGALRLELGVYADNGRALRLYERCGFVREGLQRGYALRNGRFVDSILMARWHPSPPQAPQ